MRPAQTLEKSNYESLAIVADTTGGGVLSLPTGLPFESKWVREEDSRYWFNNPYYFDYVSNAGFTTSGTLSISLGLRSISGYHADWNNELDQTQTCLNLAGTGYIFNIASSSGFLLPYSSCALFTDTYTVTINILSYDLDPGATFNSGPIVQAGQPVSITSSVNKTGNMTSSMKDENNLNGTSWRVNRFVYPGGSPFTPPATDTNDNTIPCASPAFSGHSSCTQIGDYYQADGNLATIQNYSQPVSDTIPAGLPAGSRICYVTSVARPTASGTPVWRHGAMSCTVIAKLPYMTVANSDVSAGGGVTPVCTSVGGFRANVASTFGSFGEYGLIATGSINNFGSAGFIGAGSAPLAFANVPSLGLYKPAHCIPNYVADYQSRGSVASLLPGTVSIAGLNGDYRIGGPLTLTGGTLGSGARVLIYAPGQTVNIDGNILYAPINYSSFANVPSLIIIAGKIEVANTVTELAGVYYAAGMAGSLFNTCRQATDSPNSNKALISVSGPCGTPLVVNGSVITQQLVVPRTAGGTGPDNPAETFRLRPESFLTPYEISLEDDVYVTTDLIQERPPRY